MSGAERSRVDSFGHPEDGLHEATPWYDWGPYLSERAWGTVREDYSADGAAWDYFPHDHARSRAYRWGEDGMAGVSDVGQNLCMALALWNGRDPILKERMFGLTGPRGQPRRGRQGVLVVPRRPAEPRVAALALPLPAGRVPVCRPGGRERPSRPDAAGVRAHGHRGLRRRPLLGGRRRARQGRPARPADGGPRHQCGPGRGDAARPAAAVVPQHVVLGRGRHPALAQSDRPRPGRGGAPAVRRARVGARARTRRESPELLFCENETNSRRLYGSDSSADYPKDGVNDHVVTGAPTVNPDRVGSKSAAWYRLTVAPGETQVVRVRLRAPSSAPAFGAAVRHGARAASRRGRRVLCRGDPRRRRARTPAWWRGRRSRG